MIIDGKKIGSKHKPYVIAELSANHNGSLERAIEILEMSKKMGADALKLQTYTQDTITIDSESEDFVIKNGLWAGQTLYDLYTHAHMPWEWHAPLFEKAESLELSIFSSPFDETAIDFLEDLNCPAYKIASFEAIDLPLIKYAASTGKPLIISTGMANLQEIEEAVVVAKDTGCTELALLHCVSGYPAPADEYNLKTISDLKDRFDVEIGISDHTILNTTAIAAVALGATIIEKHVTLSRNDGGPDDSFSLEPENLHDLCISSEIAWQSLGEINYDKKKSEEENIIFRRSLYVIEDITKGSSITKGNIKSIRPGYGLPPKYFTKVLGMKANQNLKKGMPLTMDLLK